jgi:hypothetical protein
MLIELPDLGSWFSPLTLSASGTSSFATLETRQGQLHDFIAHLLFRDHLMIGPSNNSGGPPLK